MLSEVKEGGEIPMTPIGVRMVEAAEALGVTRARVTQLCKAGKLGTVTHNGRTYVSTYSLKHLMAERERGRRSAEARKGLRK